MSETLKSCPFCDGEAEIVEGEESAYAQCKQVKMHRALWFDGDNNAAEEVAEQWNRRAAPPAPPPATELVEALAKARADVRAYWVPITARGQNAKNEALEVFDAALAACRAKL